MNRPWPRSWASSIRKKVVSLSMLTRSMGSIWIATCSGMGAPERWRRVVPSPEPAGKPEKPGRVLVQLQPYSLAGDPRRQRRAAIEPLGAGQRLERAGERALAFTGGGDVDPGAMVGGIDE